MPGVRESFSRHFNLPSVILDLIMKFWSEGTAKQYAPHLRRLLSFCSDGLDSLNAGVLSGAEFVTRYFRKASCDNSSVNTVYSVLSFVLSAVNGFTFDE